MDSGIYTVSFSNDAFVKRILGLVEAQLKPNKSKPQTPVKVLHHQKENLGQGTIDQILSGKQSLFWPFPRCILS